MDLADIRRLVIIAMFSDDVLIDQLTLKGGNALNLVYRFGSRSSVDIDLSLERDFQNLDDSKERIFRALRNRFAEAGLRVFDEKFRERPAQGDPARDEKWGGYQFEFKLIEIAKYEESRNDLERARRLALVTGPSEQRIFRIQISRYEYCQGKRETSFEDYTIFVYTPEMLAIEKLRAICQQMPEYSLRGHPTPRARDFYDIHSIVVGAGVHLGANDNLELVRNIFAAKAVGLGLLSKIGDHREFHRQDWPSVELTVSGELRDFDFYFDFVVEECQLLKALWEKYTP